MLLLCVLPLLVLSLCALPLLVLSLCALPLLVLPLCVLPLLVLLPHALPLCILSLLALSRISAFLSLLVRQRYCFRSRLHLRFRLASAPFPFPPSLLFLPRFLLLCLSSFLQLPSSLRCSSSVILILPRISVIIMRVSPQVNNLSLVAMVSSRI